SLSHPHLVLLPAHVLPLSYSLFFHCPRAPPPLHSFPTRRSSDLYALGLAIPFVITALALDRFLGWFQRFRPYIVWVDRIAGALLVLLGILLVTDRFTLLAGWLQGLTPEFLKSRL